MTDESGGESTEQKRQFIPSRSRLGRREDSRLAEIQRAAKDEEDETWGGGQSPFDPYRTAESADLDAEAAATEDTIEGAGGGVEIPEDGTAKAELVRPFPSRTPS